MVFELSRVYSVSQDKLVTGLDGSVHIMSITNTAVEPKPP
jgi:hypothetical protein